MRVVRALTPVALVLALTGTTPAQPKLPPGAVVETEVKARDLEILAEEGVTEALLLAVGYDVPGFAKRRDPVWGIRIGTISLETRALIWVHALSGRVLF
ncbi:MAG: hypothetical protein AABZ83_03170, partial [candidate division NC10 bacterium]